MSFAHVGNGVQQLFIGRVRATTLRGIGTLSCDHLKGLEVVQIWPRLNLFCTELQGALILDARVFHLVSKPQLRGNASGKL